MSVMGIFRQLTCYASSDTSPAARPITKDAPTPKSGAQVTLLTRSGMYVISEPPQSVINAGSALMLELMQRVKEKRG